MPKQLFQDAYEFEKRYGIERLKLTIQKAEDAYSKLAPESIDYYKCIIEIVCKKIHEIFDSNLSANPDFHGLVENTLMLLGMEKGQILAGLKTLAHGLAEKRNGCGVAGHGQINCENLISQTEIMIFVSTCENLMSILVALLNKMPIDILHTKTKYSKLEEEQQYQFRNVYIDKNVDVDYSSEDGLLFIDGKELRPSEVLYDFDRYSYKEKFDESFGAVWDEENLENLQEMISNYLCENVFDDFYPGHYGYTLPSVWFHHPEINGNFIEGEGTVEAIATIGSSKEGIEINYCSDFWVKFAYIYDKESDSFEFELIDLNLEKMDWITPEED